MQIEVKPGVKVGIEVGDVVDSTVSIWNPKGRLVVAKVSTHAIAARDENGKVYTGGSGCFRLRYRAHERKLYEDDEV